MMKIVFTGGGTGGHIFPILAVCREIKRLKPEKEIQFYYLGPATEFYKKVLSQEGIKVKTLICGKLRRYVTIISSFQNFFDLLKIPLGMLQAFFHLLFLRPRLIFSKGGYGSFPVVVAGWLLRIPIFLHESDIVPGLANRILFKFALQIFTSFPPTPYFPKEKIIVVGNPIRRELLTGSRAEGLSYFSITGEKPVILILGGSQGSQRINETVLEILPQLLKFFEVIHQTGILNFKKVKKIADFLIPVDLKIFYHPFPFLNEKELEKAYAVADLIVARAGSGTIFEIAALKKPSILIPLPESAQSHQLKNAYFYANTGAAIVIEEKNLTPHFFLEIIKQVALPENSQKMAKAAENFAKPLAAKVIAAYFLEYFLK